MAYISQEEKKAIAPKVKEILKKHGLKGSLRIDRHSTLVLTIREGAIDFMNAYSQNQDWLVDDKINEGFEVNQYSVDRSWKAPVADLFQRLVQAMKGCGWYDESDSMTDYFHIKHYVSIKIGRWDKPYILTS